MLYHGDESDINLDQHDPPEFDSFQWMSLRDLPSQVRQLSVHLLQVYPRHGCVLGCHYVLALRRHCWSKSTQY